MLRSIISKMENVKLNWDQCSENLLKNLKILWSDNGFNDVTLAFDDESQFNVNRTLLAALSPHLKSILRKVHGHEPWLYMFGLESSSFKSLLDFVFFGEISIEKDKLESFVKMANKLQINGFIHDGQLTDKYGKNEDQDQGEIMEIMNESNTSVKSQETNIDHELQIDGYNGQESDYYEDNEEYIDDQEEVFDLLTESKSTVKSQDENFDQELPKEGDFENENSLLNESTTDLKSEDNNTDLESTKNIDIKNENSSLDESSSSPTTTTVEAVNQELKIKEEVGIRCFLCKLSHFQTVEELQEHDSQIHTRNNRSTNYPCYQCDKQFKKQLWLKQHERKEHTVNSESDLTCDICYRQFKTTSKMEKHKDFSHPIPGKLYKCIICPKESLTKNASNVHYYQAHTADQRKGKLFFK